MEGTEVSHLLSWAKGLLLRRPSSIPKQLRGTWLFLVALSLIVGLAVLSLNVWGHQLSAWVKPVLNVLGVALWLGVGALVIKKVAGDAARYLHVAPPNIESRRRIREAGIKLLEALYSSNKYDRIVIVGHSLGSVIGYDILTYFWARLHEKFAAGAEQKSLTALETLEELARNPPGGPDYADAWQEHAIGIFRRTQGGETPLADYRFRYLRQPTRARGHTDGAQ
jgi:hypothetical protein